MKGAHRPEDPPATPTQLPRWWNTLAFRMALLINATVIAVLGVAEVIDFRHERQALVSQELEKLKEEANILAVARKRFDSPGDYQPFLDDFCRQMSAAASPGHHILVLDSGGTLSLRAHARANPDLEAHMTAAVQSTVPSNEFTYRGGHFLVASTQSEVGSSVVVAQSLEPMLRLIQTRAIGRLLGVGALAMLIFLVTGVGLLYWIRRPMRQLVHVVDQVGRGRFQTRAGGLGSAEVQFLAAGVNAMALSLGRVEAARLAEMERARRIQQRLLPPKDTRLQGLAIASAFAPATSVAGDLFDCVELDDGSVLLAVIDVSGHGAPAALYTALLRTVMRYELNSHDGLADLLARTNRQLLAVSGSGDFATCFVVTISPDRGQLEFAKAGHDAAILLHHDGTADLLDADGLPLGVSLDGGYRSGTFPMNSGDRLVLYTDGLHELFDAEGSSFGRGRLLQIVKDTRSHTPDEQIRRIIAAAKDFQGSNSFSDDVTLVILERD